MLGRLDAVADFTSPMWKDSLRFMEPNLCGVGGLHMGPTCEQLLADIVVPVIQQSDPQLHLEVGQDLRELFIQEVFDHLQAIGRAGQNICFIEPKYSGQGPDEQEALAQYYHDRHGLKIMHADASELTIAGNEVCYEGVVVDMGYRDYEVRDLIAMEDEGVDVEPMRKLFRENRMISSMAGDFDHKSCWELLTDPALVNKYFTAEERQIFRRHVLWTRVLADRSTTLPEGETADLLDYVHDEHELLVLKPNRSYGGDRVIIGHLIDQAEWDREIERLGRARVVGRAAIGEPASERVPGHQPARLRPHRAVLHGDRLRAEQIRARHFGTRFAKAGRQCCTTGRHVRSACRAPCRPAIRAGRQSANSRRDAADSLDGYARFFAARPI